MYSKDFNNVQTDKQWRRRCQQEELQLLDSFAGPKAHRIHQQITVQNKQHFYSNGARINMNSRPSAPASKSSMRSSNRHQYSEESKLALSTGGLSVRTPATSVYGQSDAKSQVSYRSNQSAITSASQQLRMAAMAQELHEEKARREQAELELSRVRNGLRN